MRFAAAGLLIAASFFSAAAFAQTAKEPSAMVWTGIIPDAFPGETYTWQLMPDFTYIETAIDEASGQSIQTPLSGQWDITHGMMYLDQDSLGYAFVGQIDNDMVHGTLYQYGRVLSEFCALKGENPPQDCDANNLIG